MCRTLNRLYVGIKCNFLLAVLHSLPPAPSFAMFSLANLLTLHWSYRAFGILMLHKCFSSRAPGCPPREQDTMICTNTPLPAVNTARPCWGFRERESHAAPSPKLGSSGTGWACSGQLSLADQLAAGQDVWIGETFSTYASAFPELSPLQSG